MIIDPGRKWRNIEVGPRIDVADRRDELEDVRFRAKVKLTEQRHELDEMRQAFDQQRDEFRSEQQTLTDWATEQERKHRERDSALKIQAEQLDLRESAWRSASQRWVTEKIEAEAIIRDLLEQLTSLTEPTSPVSMWPHPEMPVYE